MSPVSVLKLVKEKELNAIFEIFCLLIQVSLRVHPCEKARWGKVITPTWHGIEVSRLQPMDDPKPTNQ